MGGHARLDRPVVTARALAPIDNPGRRRGYLRVTLTAGRTAATARGSPATRAPASCAPWCDADGLAVVPGDTVIEIGADVRVILLRSV